MLLMSRTSFFLWYGRRSAFAVDSTMTMPALLGRLFGEGAGAIGEAVVGYVDPATLIPIALREFREPKLTFEDRRDRSLRGGGGTGHFPIVIDGRRGRERQRRDCRVMLAR